MKHRVVFIFGCFAVFVSACQTVNAQLRFEEAPISYTSDQTENDVTRLQMKIDSGEVKLNYDPSLGYLPDLLRELKIKQQSQLLVFSRTSLQISRITPKRPRALYFNDENYVGFVQRGDVLEISTVDPQKGAVFYTLQQRSMEKPTFVRDRGTCLSCHANHRTQGVPGHLVRSMIVDRQGNPLYGEGTFNIDQDSPLSHRWGGWYVTGTHSDMQHMGNIVSESRDEPKFRDDQAGLNVTSLDGLIDTSRYLQPTSDIVAHMVLEHQSQMHNFLTLANFDTRSAIAYNRLMNETLDREADFLSDSTKRRIESVSQKVVDCMLFVNEFQLTSPVSGSSEFTVEFTAAGPADSQGRSLRQFDLQTRLFKYPCSYLIYSEAFDGLPTIVKQKIVNKLIALLNVDPNEKIDDAFINLTHVDRQNIREILAETKPEYGWVK